MMMVMSVAMVLASGIKAQAGSVSVNDLKTPVWDEKIHLESNTHKTEYHCVYFGSYPQSEVLGAELTDNIVNAKYDSNNEAVIQNRRYRRVNVNQSSMMASYILKNDEESIAELKEKWRKVNGTEYRYFVYEPIRWQILENQSGRMLLLSEKVLDEQFIAVSGANEYPVWNDTGLRMWLNNDGVSQVYLQWEQNCPSKYYPNSKGFGKYAFSKPEMQRIQTTQLTNFNFADGMRRVQTESNDKIFILIGTDFEKHEYGFCNGNDPGSFGSCSAKWKIRSQYVTALVGSENLGENKNLSRGSIWGREGYGRFNWEYIASRNWNELAWDRAEGIAPAINVSYRLSDCIRVSFDAGGETAYEDQILLGSNMAMKPKDPVLRFEGCAGFAGWYLDQNCTKKYDFGTLLTKDTVLYAGWYVKGNPSKIVSAATVKNREKYDNAKEFVVGGLQYRVVSRDKKQVACKGTVNQTVNKITIPASVNYNGTVYTVTEIANEAFRDNSKITELTLPKTIQSVGIYAFADCTKLNKITLGLTKIDSNVMRQGAFSGLSAKAVVNAGNATVRQAFWLYITDDFSAKKMKYTVISKTNKTVSCGGCSSEKAKKANIPATINYQGNIYRVTAIGNSAFESYSKLTTVTIGKNVSKIGKNAFANSNKLKKVTIKTTLLTQKSIGKNAFKKIHTSAVIKVPKKKWKTYKKYKELKKYKVLQ